MNPLEKPLFARCLEVLEKLPFVEEAGFLVEDRGQHPRADARLKLVTRTGAYDFDVEAKQTHLTRTIVDGVLARMASQGARRWILFAPHVGRNLAAYLDEQDANFVDPAGNCRLRLGRRYVAKIEGRPAQRRPPTGRGMGAAGFKIVFALLVRPELLQGPTRALAAAAGVAPATAADRVARLREEKLVHGVGKNTQLTEPRRFNELWLKGYETLLRPRLLIGRYRTRTVDPFETEKVIEKALGTDLPWAYGAGAAAHRLIGFYRGPNTVVHLGKADFNLARRLQALPASDGPIILLEAPGPLAFQGRIPRTVVPQLVYAELLVAADTRARAAAVELQRRYPECIP